MIFKYNACFFPVLLFISGAFAQGSSLEEKTPVLVDGFEYGYSIRNEQVKTTKNEEFARFELTFYVTNKSGCTKLYADHVALLSDETANLIATFICSNANGKRLTSKGGSVKARDFYVNAKVNIGGKEVSQSVKAGYIFRNGETLKNNVIVLLPPGERPQISFNTNNLPELR